MTTAIQRSATAGSAFVLAALQIAALVLHGSGCSSSESDSPRSVDAGREGGPIIKEPDAAPWTPANLFPAFWLDGDDVTESGLVAQWPDKSGNDNHATQNEVSLRPSTATLEGHKVISFDGTKRMAMADASSLQWAKDDFAVFSVVQYTGVKDSALAAIYLKNVAPEPYPGVHLLVSAPDGGSSPSQFWMGTGSNSRILSAKSGGYADGKPHLTMLRRRGIELDLRVDFRAAGTMPVTAVPNVSAAGGVGNIGGQGTGGFLQGDIATLIGVHGTVTDENVADVEIYLKDRYQL